MDSIRGNSCHEIVLEQLFGLPHKITSPFMQKWLFLSKFTGKNSFLVAFRALRGTPGLRDGSCTTPGGGRGRTNQRDLTGDRFQVIVPLFPYEYGGEVRSKYLGGIFGRFGALKRAPGVRDG